ncbi:hypothetical protein [Shewanella sp. S23-S33]|uniref:hypothetical protein n=1 Tax=Shewanella sp. S23-S33 TaxID=3342769 RepID=UPI00372D50EA
MSQWLQSAKATVSAGAAVISFTDNKDFASVRAGDVVMLNGQIWQCASGTRPDSAGKSTVTLAAPWPYTGASNVNAFVFRTTHDLLQLTSDARKLTNITKALLAAQEDILKGTTPTINVPIGLDPATGNEEVIAVTPWQYVINVVNASLGNISAIGAMSQAQFDAIRAQNNEQFAASGFVHFGKQLPTGLSTLVPINEGMTSIAEVGNANLLLLGRYISATNASGKSTKEYPVVNIAGVITHIEKLNLSSTSTPSIVKFPQAPDGKETYNKSTGVVTKHTTVTAAFNAQAADPTNVEVVTDRVDMWGFEAFLEEVNTTNPYVYPNGLIQSQATTMDGIATSASARPVTYYAVFDGDTGSKGKGLNYFALSDANKKKVLANSKNNLYYLADGRLVQWRLRQRSFAGTGNGDWYDIESTSPNILQFTSSNNTRLSPQGFRDAPYISPNQSYFAGHGGSGAYAKNPSVGLFSVGGTVSEGAGLFSECYLLICGTVNRLNQGAYHHSFNPSGTSRIWDSTGTAPLFWHQSTRIFNSISDCFDFDTGANADARKLKVISAQFSKPFNGSIGSNYPARPDGRVYDAIYADGQGGVCRDMRYSANGVDLVDFAEADQKVKNGTYRGYERSLYSLVIPVVSNLVGSNTVTFPDNVTRISKPVKGETIYIVKAGVITKHTVTNDNWYLNNKMIFTPAIDLVSGNHIVASARLLSSVGGSFLQTDVIGNPANILATPQLANGWQGSWGGVAELGGVNKSGTRKMISSGTLVYTTNNGTTWLTSILPQPNVSNTITTTYSTNEVRICQYQAFSKQTEVAVNSVVYGGNLGIGEVSANSNYRMENGALLFESLIGKIPVNSLYLPPNRFGGNFAITSKFLTNLGKLDGTYLPEHFALSLGTPNNSSPAIKALNYNVNLNQQAFIQYAYTELMHNGTNWGDDGKMTIIDNQSTKTDLNGNTVLVGTAKLKEPIGWIKNKV